MTDAACRLDRRLPSEFARELEPGGAVHRTGSDAL
jgi:hypothetical protein